MLTFDLSMDDSGKCLGAEARLVVEIEHCVDCNDHRYCTRHDEDKYKDYASLAKTEILKLWFPDQQRRPLNIVINPSPLGRKDSSRCESENIRVQRHPFKSHSYLVKDLGRYPVSNHKVRYSRSAGVESPP
eukprot:GHVQ01017279.1.p1 GENE.GHVQ01017279.1~~GHVQ01017279.1.p1  ORF type:complete len:131 (+),score=4.91 GHVQ01017279.1:585-977(+)